MNAGKQVRQLQFLKTPYLYYPIELFFFVHKFEKYKNKMLNFDSAFLQFKKEFFRFLKYEKTSQL